MTVRVGPSIVPGRVACGFRGHGVLGSALAHGGAYDGLTYRALNGAPDASKEYRYFVPSPPAGLTNLQADGAFDYAGTSVAFDLDIYEAGVLLGRRTASVLIDGLPVPESIVTGLTVTPGAVTMFAETQQFTATVLGENSPSQAVTWAAGAGGISTSGLFNRPAQTDAEQVITITATSVQNGSFSGTANVIIPAAGTQAPTGTVEFRRMRKNTMRVVRLA